MSLAINVLPAAAAAGILFLVLGNGDKAPAGAAEIGRADVAVVHWKDQSRLAQGTSDSDEADLLTQLAQASRPAGGPLEPPQRVPPLPPHSLDGPGPFDLPPEPPFFGARRPMSRIACETRLDLQAGMIAFLTSKLRLTDDQRQAWRKVEDAAQPAIAKLHAACDQLARGPGEAPDLPDAFDIMETQAAAKLDLLRATRGPVLALYQMLTSQQRDELRPHMPPMPIR